MSSSTLTEPTTATGSRRILLVCFRFGPGCDTGGYRWTALVQDLVERGWRFDVLTVGNLVSEGGTGRIDSEFYGGAVRVFQIADAWWGQRLRDRFGALGARRGSPGADENPAPSEAPASSERRAWFEALQAGAKYELNASAELLRDIDWTRRARAKARELAARHRYHCVVVSSPRHMNQLIGADLYDRFRVPYVADFRDPWYYGRGSDLRRVHRATRLTWRAAELYCMRRAACAIDISEAAYAAVQEALPSSASPPRHFIPSGYERMSRVAAPDPTCFRLLYSGTVYPFNPLPHVMAAYARFVIRHELSPRDTRFECIGFIPEIDGRSPEALARGVRITEYFDYRRRQPNAVATRAQQRAALLLAFDSVTSTALNIPSKVYHYAQMKGDLLLVGNPRGAMALEAAKIGAVVISPAHTLALDQALDRAYARWQDGAMNQRNDPNGVFDFQRQSARMHQLLNGI